MTGAAGERPPEKVLVERERAAVRVTVPEVHVQPFEIGGREHGTAQQARLEVRDVLLEPGLDPVRVALLQPLLPDALADVELACCVAFHAPGQLLELDPQEALARRCTRRVDRQRLADDDRRLGRQQPALRLVDRT